MKTSTPELPDTLKVSAPLGTSLTEGREGSFQRAQDRDHSGVVGGGCQATQTAPPNSRIGERQGTATSRETSLTGHQAAWALYQLSTDSHVTHPGHFLLSSGLSLPICNMGLCSNGKALSADLMWNLGPKTDTRERGMGPNHGT